MDDSPVCYKIYNEKGILVESKVVENNGILEIPEKRMQYQPMEGWCTVRDRQPVPPKEILNTAVPSTYDDCD